MELAGTPTLKEKELRVSTDLLLLKLRHALFLYAMWRHVGPKPIATYIYAVT